MKTTLSFHATRHDVLGLVAPWAAEFQLTLVYEQFSPIYRVARVAQAKDGIDFGGPLDRLSLHLGEIDPVADSALNFIDKNPDGLSITFGAESDEGLRISRLGAGTDDEVAERIWKKLRNRARKAMRRGAWVVNIESASRVRDDSHLYMPGAKDLQDRGVPILGPSDWIRFELD